VTAPLPQLIAPLIRAGFAPYTAANLLGVYGNLSMLPLLFVELLAIGSLLLLVEARWRERGLSVALAVLLLPLPPAPSFPADDGAGRKALVFIKRTWTPSERAELEADAL